ncbi:DUF6456 domain-containing protein [Falsihalocynthiibacter sp. SS001]|uniref:DUF6456 domain-containing protein n=1 Tax=Falsihalocynthiibacter sp. SS001 TaxID=3349698 RepID=UPI0036D37BC7
MGNDLGYVPSRAPLPHWVPDAAERYLLHTESGLSIRAVARDAGCHASTVLRQIRRFESRRDDILVDQALRRLGTSHFAKLDEEASHSLPRRNPKPTPEDQNLHEEAYRVLRRLCETGAVLVVSETMEKAAVFRSREGGQSTRTAVVDKNTAEAMALKEWIKCIRSGKVSQYEATISGRRFLKSCMDQQEAQHGFAEAQAYFTPAPAPWSRAEERTTKRYTLAENPLIALSRRRDKDGNPFLSDALVAAGERLREDYELAQLGLQGGRIWEQYLSEMETGEGPDVPKFRDDMQRAAHDRTRDALRDLGPGLGDAVLRCCCLQEGMETTEKEMDWAARSGKIVLKIGLQRLAYHYGKRYGKHGPMIG